MVLEVNERLDSRFWQDGAVLCKERAKALNEGGPTIGRQLSPIWQYYYMSTEKNASTRRHKAKCRFCFFEMSGRLSSMMSHSANCPKLPASRYREVLLLQSEKADSATDTMKNEVSTPSVTQKRPCPDIVDYRPPDTQRTPLPPAAGKANQANPGGLRAPDIKAVAKIDHRQLNALLTKALIGSGFPLQILDNESFIAFLRGLQPQYEHPSQDEIATRYLPAEVDNSQVLLREYLKGQDNLTLSLAMHAHTSESNLLVLVVSCRELLQPLLLDVRLPEFSMLTPPKKLHDTISTTLQSVGLCWEQIKAITTQMLPATNQPGETIPATLSDSIALPCLDFGLDLVLAGYLQYPGAQDMWRKSYLLVAFFLSSPYWGGKLTSMTSEDSSVKSHTLERCYKHLKFYSQGEATNVSQILLFVMENEEGIKACVDKYTQQKENFEIAIPQAVQELAADKSFFQTNVVWATLVALVSDAKLKMTYPDITVGDGIHEFLLLYRLTKEASVDVASRDVKEHCLAILTARFADLFSSPVYVLGMLLDPKHRKLALSSSYKLWDAYHDMLPLLKSWKFKRGEVKGVQSALREYAEVVGYFGNLDRKEEPPHQWWNNISTSDPEVLSLRRLALTLHSIAPLTVSLHELLAYQAVEKDSATTTGGLSLDTFLRLKQAYALEQFKRKGPLLEQNEQFKPLAKRLCVRQDCEKQTTPVESSCAPRRNDDLTLSGGPFEKRSISSRSFDFQASPTKGMSTLGGTTSIFITPRFDTLKIEEARFTDFLSCLCAAEQAFIDSQGTSQTCKPDVGTIANGRGNEAEKEARRGWTALLQQVPSQGLESLFQLDLLKVAKKRQVDGRQVEDPETSCSEGKDDDDDWDVSEFMKKL